MAEQPVHVEPWVVLAAIRYGLPRVSYAHSESLQLIAQHAPLLAAHGWLDTVVDDIELYCADRRRCSPDIDHRRAQQAVADAYLAVRGARHG